MVTLPAEGRWSIKSLTDADAPAALAFLERDPLINVYLISRLLEDRSGSASQMVEVRYNRELVVVASLATNVVLAAGRDAAQDVVDTAIAIIADRLLTRMLPVRAIISPAALVESLWSRVKDRIDPPTVVRMTQPIYAIRGRLDYPDLHESTYATMRDLDALVPACAAMHMEEVGIDPLERDAAGYRDRVRELVEKKRSVVRKAGGVIAAKCEFSAVTSDAVQLMGVWTYPTWRSSRRCRMSISI